jgi:hypothetical protein
MANTIKIKCNGAEPHVNNIDLDNALSEALIYKGLETWLQDLPERVTLRCQESGCTGRIVITGLMLQEMLGENHA